jgi:hypothetical protein
MSQKNSQQSVDVPDRAIEEARPRTWDGATRVTERHEEVVPPLPPDPTARADGDSDPPAPSILTEAEVRYWKRVLAGLEQADQCMRQSQQLEAQAAQLRERAAMLTGAYESYQADLVEAHGIDPAHQRITPEGQIVLIDPTPR